MLEKATELLSGDKYMTLSLVMPTFIELFSYIECVMIQDNVSNIVKEALSNSHSVLSKYYGFSDDTTFYLAAVILDPRFKAQYLIDKEFNQLCDNIVDKTVDWAKQMSDFTQNAGPDKHTEVTPQGNSRLLTKMFLHSASKTNTPEIDQYLELVVESYSIDPLQWCKTHIPEFPKLSSVAREILAIPGSSISDEHIFNVGRNVIGIRRNSLNSETISPLMFGNHYMK
jgi:hypothetical protein